MAATPWGLARGVETAKWRKSARTRRLAQPAPPGKRPPSQRRTAASNIRLYFKIGGSSIVIFFIYLLY